MAQSLFTKTIWTSTEPLLKTDKERKVLKSEVTITRELSPGNLCLKVQGWKSLYEDLNEPWKKYANWQSAKYSKIFADN